MLGGSDKLAKAENQESIKGSVSAGEQRVHFQAALRQQFGDQNACWLHLCRLSCPLRGRTKQDRQVMIVSFCSYNRILAQDISTNTFC